MALGMGKIIPALDLKGCHGSSWYYHSKSLINVGYRSADLIIDKFQGGVHNMQKYHHGMTVRYFTDLVQL